MSSLWLAYGNFFVVVLGLIKYGLPKLHQALRHRHDRISADWSKELKTLKTAKDLYADAQYQLKVCEEHLQHIQKKYHQQTEVLLQEIHQKTQTICANYERQANNGLENIHKAATDEMAQLFLKQSITEAKNLLITSNASLETPNKYLRWLPSMLAQLHEKSL